MYKWKKDLVSWRVGRTLYLSVVFSWHIKQAKMMAKTHRGPAVAGGPALAGQDIDWAKTPGVSGFDVLSMHNPCATFTTRGCSNNCSFCTVPKIEGAFRELETWKPAPLICDNNITRASRGHFSRVIDSIKHFPMVDFNQGLEARALKDWHINEMARLKAVKIRFAFDNVNQEHHVKSAIDRARYGGFNDFGVYVLIGHNDTPEDALYRLELVRSWGILPNPMRYQPIDTGEKNAFLSPKWTQNTMKRVMRYYSRLVYFGHIPFEDFSTENVTQPSLFDEMT